MKSKSLLGRLCMMVTLGVIAFATVDKAASQVNGDDSTASKTKSMSIHSLLSDLYKNKKLNGTVLVSENSKVIYSGAFGYGNFETNEKLRPSS